LISTKDYGDCDATGDKCLIYGENSTNALLDGKAAHNGADVYIMKGFMKV